MTPKAAVLFATNEAKLYQEHLALARRKAVLSDWIRHIERFVIPTYRREIYEPFEGMSINEIDETAELLQAYYEEHILEGA